MSWSGLEKWERGRLTKCVEKFAKNTILFENSKNEFFVINFLSTAVGLKRIGQSGDKQLTKTTIMI